MDFPITDLMDEQECYAQLGDCFRVAQGGESNRAASQFTSPRCRVVAALAKHDSELARKTMSDHLAAGAAPLIDHLAEHGVVDST